MNHLPLVVGAKYPQLLVPCVCDPHYYEGDDFETFPARKGFALIMQDGWAVGILNKDKTRLTSSKVAEVSQAWLFFGLLIDVFKVASVVVNPDDFVWSDGQEEYITMNSLPHYLEQWESQAKTLSVADRKVIFRRQQNIIMRALLFHDCGLSGKWPLLLVARPAMLYKESIPFSIEMSIVILYETLDRTTRRIRGVDPNIATGDELNSALLKHFVENGWCPSEISIVSQGLDHAAAYLASRLYRKRTMANHSQCSATKCKAYQISVESYKTHHVMNCSECKPVGVDTYKLASILHQDRIPRARILVTDTRNDPQVEVAVEDSGPYVAISHVWSDGLGNATENSLPACQLLRIYKLVLALNVNFDRPSPAIWMDSLLVPVEKGPEKRLALARLYDYYQKADKVLVLDSDLLQASQLCSREEQFLRILFSTWMRRLWTLEEGVLSRTKLMFQFNDGTVSMDDIGDDSYASSSPTGIYYNLQLQLMRFLPNIANHYVHQGNQSIQLHYRLIEELLPAIQYRSTTKAIDEPICIAHILGLDVSRLLCTEDIPCRMKELIMILAEHGTLFRREFLFTQESKLELDGVRWAPTSFMALSSNDTYFLRHNPRSHYSTCNSKGLSINGMHCFKINFNNQRLKKVTFVKVDLIIYALVPVPVGKCCQYGGRYWTSKASGDAFNVDPDKHWNTKWQEMLGANPSNMVILYDVPQYGVAISMYDYQGHPNGPEGSVIFGRLIGQVYMYELKTRDQNHAVVGQTRDTINFTNPGWDFDEMERQMQAALENALDPEYSIFAQVTQIEPSQRWYIG